jgi:NADPH-dependent 2,4-dienoyl-CoA reductase/sulfur reductase-like enzyme
MLKYKYFIVGGGMTADAAVHGIREVDHEGSIGLISAERQPPYKRPPLSKALWKGKPLVEIWEKAAAQSATLHLGRKVVGLDVQRRRVIDDQGTTYDYEKLLLATGGTPRRLPDDPPGVMYFRTVDDYLELRRLADRRRRFAVIGGGFIGSEIAAALAMIGMEVVMIFPEHGIGAAMFPADLSESLNAVYREKGVELRTGAQVAGVESRDGQLAIKLESDHKPSEPEIVVDAVVAGIGIQPNVELALSAGLEVGDGIRVDPSLRTSWPDVFAAGDVAEFYNPALEKYVRVEHEDNANTMGEMAGRSMAGEAVSYDHLPFFYSDLFELGYEAVGEVNARLHTVDDWKEPFREGVVFYLRYGRVRGILMWNVWDRVDAARHLIAEPGPFKPEDLRSLLLESPQHA